MSSIGTLLRDTRNKKALTLDEVYSRIKIHPRVLNLLEEGRFEKLPSPLFAKSFIKTYAEFLELNAEDLLRTYEKEDKKEPEQILFIKPVGQRPEFGQTKNLFTVLIVIFSITAVALVGFYFVKMASGLMRPRSSIGVEQKKPAVEPANKADWQRSVSQGNFPQIGAKTPLDLKVHALDNVWLRVTCDGKVLFQSILKRGASESWSASKNIEIWTGNASSMSLILNRTNLGSPGKGVVKKMMVSREGVRVNG